MEPKKLNQSDSIQMNHFLWQNIWLKIPETENFLVYLSDNHDKKLKSKSRKNILHFVTGKLIFI